MSDLLNNLFTKWKPIRDYPEKYKSRKNTNGLSSVFSDLLDGGVAYYASDRENKIPIYQAEVDSNLYCAIAHNTVSCPVEIVRTNGNAVELATASEGDDTLYNIKFILATASTTTPNLNDDMFLPVHTYPAIGSAVHKSINLKHQPRDIVGHMTEAYAVGADYEVIEQEGIPEFFHILSHGVLYKHIKSRDSELTEQTAALISDIEAGKYKVSMECVFSSFSYLLGNDFVSRNEDTAFLTKYLRIYGGSGSYQGKRIYRVLENITFSAVGLVLQPANPDSIIL